MGGIGGTILDRFVTEFLFAADTSTLDTIEKRINATRQRLDRASRSFFVMGAAGTAALGGIISKASGTDSALRSLEARSGANAEQLDAFKTQAKAVSQTLPLMTRDVILGQRAYLQLGNTIENTLAATPALARFTAAAADSGVTMESASRFATVATKAWGLEAEETGRITDVLLKAQTRSAADAYQLGQAFQYSAQSASDAGLTLEGYVAILGGLAEGGREVEASSQGLQLFLSNVARAREGGFRGGELVAKAFGRAGIDRATLTQLTQQGDQGYFALFNLLRERTADDLNLRTAIMTQLAGQSYGPALAATLKNIEDVQADYDVLRASKGETDRQAAIMMQGLSGSINLAKSALDVFILGLADVGISAFGKSMIDTFTSVVAWLGKTDEETNTLVNGGILRLISSGIILTAGLLGVGAGLQIVSFALGGYLTVVKTAHWLTDLWTAKQWTLNAAFWANPVGLVVIGVVALAAAAVAVWYWWDKIAGLWRRLWGLKPTAELTPKTDLQKAGRAIPETLAEGIAKGGSSVAKAFEEQMKPVERMLPKSDAETGPFRYLTRAGEAIPETIAEGMRSTGDQQWVFEGVFKSGLEWLEQFDLFTTGRHWIQTLIDGLWSMGGTVADAFRALFAEEEPAPARVGQVIIGNPVMDIEPTLTGLEQKLLNLNTFNAHQQSYIAKSRLNRALRELNPSAVPQTPFSVPTITHGLTPAPVPITGITAPLPVAPVVPVPTPAPRQPFVPPGGNAQEAREGGMVVTIEQLTVNANDVEGGEAAAEAFMETLQQERLAAVQQWDSTRLL